MNSGCCAWQALAPGSDTALDAETLEAVAESAPSVELSRAEVLGQSLPDVMVYIKLQDSKAAARRLIKVGICTILRSCAWWTLCEMYSASLAHVQVVSVCVSKALSDSVQELRCTGQQHTALSARPSSSALRSCAACLLFAEISIVMVRLSCMQGGGVRLNNVKVESEQHVLEEGDLIEGRLVLIAAGKKNKMLVRVCS